MVKCQQVNFLNYAKTEYLLIKPKTNSSQLCKFTLTINGIELQKCQSAKYLGIILDENLTWESHIQYLEKQLSQAVGIIAKMRHYLNHENLIALYYVFFYSHLLYAFLVGVVHLKLGKHRFKSSKTRY